jgi:diketogulonate reductase-like aldo/keto reductase
MWDARIMRDEVFGPLGRRLPAVGLGTWHMEQDDRRGAIAAIHRALDLGMTHIDTAELYAEGRVEELVGEALRGQRDRAFLVSKVLPDHASRRGTIEACDASLRRLGTDRLDLYLLHWRGRHPLAETFAAFDELVAAGKIAAFGVSNFDADDLDEALALVGPGRIACDQVLYHLGERTIEHGILPWCEAHQVALVAYSPFGSGDFPAPDTAGGRALATVGAARGVTPHQVALAFLTRRPGVFAIPKAARIAHVEAAAAAGDLVLTPAEVSQIDGAFPLGRWRGLPSL